MKTAFSGPLIVYGDRNPPGTGSTGTVNTDKAPSVFWGGAALLDPRAGYNLYRKGCLGFQGSTEIPVLDVAPATLSAAGIAALQHTTSGTALTLAIASTGITVLATALTVWPSGNAVPVGALVIDANPSLVTFGTADISNTFTSVSLYNPTKATGRALSITSTADFSGKVFTVAGYDIYGYPQTEAITGPNNTTVNGKKAFKFVVSVTPNGTDASNNVSIGVSDIIGLPMRADTFGDVSIRYNSAVVTASTGFVAADATSPATTTTGDPRGTYALQTASDGTRRLQVALTPKLANLGTITGLFGVTPV